jgi:hypothetical protein
MSSCVSPRLGNEIDRRAVVKAVLAIGQASAYIARITDNDPAGRR